MAMIEALVSVVVFMVGILGIYKLLSISLSASRSNEEYGIVLRLVEEASERIILLSNYKNSEGKNAFLDSASCAALMDIVKKKQCALGLQSRAEWNENLIKSLPNATANIIKTGANNSIQISINWKQKIVGSAAKNQGLIDANYTTVVDF
jgi:Tfp pilus assembly protein PilV